MFGNINEKNICLLISELSLYKIWWIFMMASVSKAFPLQSLIKQLRINDPQAISTTAKTSLSSISKLSRSPLRTDKTIHVLFRRRKSVDCEPLQSVERLLLDINESKTKIVNSKVTLTNKIQPIDFKQFHASSFQEDLKIYYKLLSEINLSTPEYVKKELTNIDDLLFSYSITMTDLGNLCCFSQQNCSPDQISSSNVIDGPLQKRSDYLSMLQRTLENLGQFLTNYRSHERLLCHW